MQDADQAQRDALMEAAITLAEQRGGVLALPLAEVAQQAHEPLADAERLYPELTPFWLDLLQYLLDLARAAVIESMPGTRPGLSRIRTAYETYLDTNLRHRALRELALHFRGHAEGAERLRSRAHGVMLITQVELRTAGWPNAAPAARLLTAMVLEVALAEYEAAAPLPDLRTAMFNYLNLPASGTQADPMP